jgi:nucleotide-binding universal stress UspA family protein
MREKQNVLVAVDESPQGIDTARYAARMLAGCGVRIVLYHVYMNIDEAFYDIAIDPAGRRHMAGLHAWERQQRQAAEEMLAKARRIMVEAGVDSQYISVRCEPRKVGIARDIVKESLEGYDLVVIGRKGHHLIKGLVLGSVANKLIERLRHVTVWVVGGNPAPEKLLIGLDASDGAMRAVNRVAAACRGGDQREIYLVHVIRAWKTIPPTLLAQLEQDRIDALTAEAVASIQPVFEEATRRLEAAGCKPNRIHTQVVSGVDSRAMAMIQFARQKEVGTLVMGRRGLSRVEEFVMGRVGHKIVNTVRNRAVWIVV